MSGRQRGFSFHQVDYEEASGILSNVLNESEVYLGGCSFGVGLKKAALHYLQQQQQLKKSSLQTSHLNFPGAKELNPECNPTPLEEPFFVLDIGVVVSQVYQWRKFFPRIEPFYAVKCNPDPVVVKTLAILGCNFDCASRQEIRLVQEMTQDLPRQPDIIYANPCKARAHLVEAVCRGVKMVTFDNLVEIHKCAAVSKHIELILRIMTDDRGSQCRFSSKFGAPPHKWRPLLAAAKQHGLQVVGVSFHVGSGCRDASKYELALRDAKKIFEMGEKEFGFQMKILDIGGGFPGETHSIWNPAVELDEDDHDEVEGKEADSNGGENDQDDDRFMFFTEVAEAVVPVVDELFPPESGVRLIAEPGRYFVAAAATLCCSVVAARINDSDGEVFHPEAIDDTKAAKALDSLSREEQSDLVQRRPQCDSIVSTATDEDKMLSTIQDELLDYSKLFATQELTQQEFDVYNDKLDMYEEGYKSAIDVLGPPEEDQMAIQYHTAEGMTKPLVSASTDLENVGAQDGSALLSLAAAGEAVVSGVVMQAMVDSAPMQDDYAYYINDGVYGSFNNIMFDHARVRPRVLSMNHGAVNATTKDGLLNLNGTTNESDFKETKQRSLYASTVFGPTCDSIDVISRSVLLPKLTVGDWMYFTNMGAYTMAAASSFNGFSPSSTFYVCSVQPEYFEEMIKGPKASQANADTGVEEGLLSNAEKQDPQ